MVLHIPGDIIGTPAFERTLDDVALMSLLGVKIVLVCGIAHQVRRGEGGAVDGCHRVRAHAF